jgi:uncharacterized iron-regulated membrane protein
MSTTTDPPLADDEPPGAAAPETITEAPGRPAAEPAAPRKTRRRVPRPMSTVRWLHRWGGLVAGLLLVMVTTTGAVLLYEPALEKVLHPSRYDGTPTARPIGFAKATDDAQRAYPGSTATYAVKLDEVYEVSLTAKSGDSFNVTLDQADGRVLSRFGNGSGVLGLFVNFHECGLTCEGYPGYVPLFAKQMPDIGIQGVDKITVGGFVLGLVGVLLLGLAISGIVVWWPKPRKRAWKKGLTLRWKKGSYARNYDLHKLIGLIALPFLLMWAITGANFELPVVAKAWYAVLPGDAPKDPILVSKDGKGPDIGIVRAEAAARATLRHPGVLAAYLPPSPDDPGSPYEFGYRTTSLPHAATEDRVNEWVDVDRRDATHTKFEGQGQPGRRVAQSLLEDWGTATHFGTLVNGWWRAIWFVMGMAPLALMITGVATWLHKRRKRRAKARRKKAAGAAPAA